mmetsp:Transcript_9384/g.36626  ORF Transcript_9384/g.36626 Transcript_9384/m.36626 type:complete len:236 (+) Transcript_9384:263-970(+)
MPGRAPGRHGASSGLRRRAAGAALPCPLRHRLEGRRGRPSSHSPALPCAAAATLPRWLGGPLTLPGSSQQQRGRRFRRRPLRAAVRILPRLRWQAPAETAPAALGPEPDHWTRGSSPRGSAAGWERRAGAGCCRAGADRASRDRRRGEGGGTDWAPRRRPPPRQRRLEAPQAGPPTGLKPPRRRGGRRWLRAGGCSWGLQQWMALQGSRALGRRPPPCGPRGRAWRQRRGAAWRR